MSWLEVRIKLPEHWVGTDDDMGPDLLPDCVVYLDAELCAGGPPEVERHDGHVVVSLSGETSYGMATLRAEFARLIDLRIPFEVFDDGQSDEPTPPDWYLYDGREVPPCERSSSAVYFHAGTTTMTRGELQAILDGTHGWARTPLDYFDARPTLEACSIEHLIGAPHPDETDDVDDARAVL